MELRDKIKASGIMFIKPSGEYTDSIYWVQKQTKHGKSGMDVGKGTVITAMSILIFIDGNIIHSILRAQGSTEKLSDTYSSSGFHITFMYTVVFILLCKKLVTSPQARMPGSFLRVHSSLRLHAIFCNVLVFYSKELVAPPPNPNGGLPFVDCPQLLIQYTVATLHI
jgi:hypothetical protein